MGRGARLCGGARIIMASPIRTQGLRSRAIRIDEGAWIASHVSILTGVTIGRGAIVGAGSVATHDVPPMAVAAGVPARVIACRTGAQAQAEGASAHSAEERKA
jgi:acetyltransferase-like isoleucine patch superfamily enzyme